MGEGPSAAEKCLGALAGGVCGLAVGACSHRVPIAVTMAPAQIRRLLVFLRTRSSVGNALPTTKLGCPLISEHVCSCQAPLWI